MEPNLPELVTPERKREWLAETRAAVTAPPPVPAPPTADPDPSLPTARSDGRLAANAVKKPCLTCHEVHPYMTRSCVPLLFVNIDPLATDVAEGYPLVSAPPGLVVLELDMSRGATRTAVTRPSGPPGPPHAP